jgi:hypothetical protein
MRDVHSNLPLRVEVISVGNQLFVPPEIAQGFHLVSIL